MKPTTLKSDRVLGSVEICVRIEDEGLLNALYEAFYRDSKDVKARYSTKREGQELVMSAEGLDIGDLRAFINSNLRLLKVVFEGLQVIR